MDAGVPITRAGRRHRDGADQGGRRLHRPHRHRRRRGPPRRHGLQGRRHRSRHHGAADGHQDLGRHVRDPARRADAGATRRGSSSSARWPRCSTAPREALSLYAPRIEKVKIDPSQIGLLIGKGGETIRGLCEEYESQIDVNDDGQVLIYSANGELADALVERIRTMMKEVEIGDEYLGKVVKTTAFGAFIELSKGTDGLLHISNVSPGNRVETVEEVLSKGDEITVRVVEVDRERGRIGVRRSDDPEIAGKTRRGARDTRDRRRWRRRRRRRRRGPRSAPARATATAAAAGATAARAAPAARAIATARAVTSQVGNAHVITDAARWRARRHRARAHRCARWRSASGSAPARAPRATRRLGSPTCSSTCSSAARSATARRRSTRSSTRWAPS